MQPGYPGSGQDPYNQNPSSPFDTPGYGSYPSAPDPYAAQPPSSPYQDPYAAPASGQPYQAPSSGQPASGQPYQGQPYQQPYPPQSAPPVAGYGYQPPVVYTTGPGYMVPGGQPAANNTMGLLAMIFGIAAIPLACCFYIGIPLGIAGAVLGYLGMNKARQGLANNRGMALAGLICGCCGAGLGIVLIILNVVLSSSNYGYY